MRKVIIWVSVVIIFIGFVYIGNNLIAYNSENNFATQYLPKSTLLVRFNESTFRYAKDMFFNSSLPISPHNGYFLNFSNNSKAFIFAIKSDNATFLDNFSSKLKANGYALKKLWKEGFPIISTHNQNGAYYISGWRNFVFLSNNSSALEKIFAGITQKGNLIKNDPVFTELWNGKALEFFGIIYPGAKELLESNLQIPFLKFYYPLSFTVKEKTDGYTLNINSIYSSGKEAISFAPFDFDDALLEVALPHANEIKEDLINSGLSLIVSDRMGISLENLSLFSSSQPAEFILLKNREFLLVKTSNPVANTNYRNEILNNLKNVEVTKTPISNFSIDEYKSDTSDFYVLEFPDMFFISTNKEALQDIALKKAGREKENLSAFLKTSYELNEVKNLYHLNISQVKLPFASKNCTVYETYSDEKLHVDIDLN